MISVTQMEYILAVAKERNFRRAAASCHVTQPTLSLQIQKFEEEIGTPVFDRSHSPVQPTRLGTLLIQQIQEAYTETRRIQEIIDKDSGKVTGELRVGVIPTVAPYLIPLFIGQLHKNYPDLELSISEKTTENCLLALDSEEIDAAILATKEDRKKYQQDNLYSEDLLLYVNSNHKFAKNKSIHADELEHCDIWLLEEGHCLKDDIIKACRLREEKGNKPKSLNLKVGSLEALRYLVEENFGYTLLPRLSTKKLQRTKKAVVRELSKPVPSRTVNITRRKRALKNAAVDALKESILKTV